PASCSPPFSCERMAQWPKAAPGGLSGQPGADPAGFPRDKVPAEAYLNRRLFAVHALAQQASGLSPHGAHGRAKAGDAQRPGARMVVKADQGEVSSKRLAFAGRGPGETEGHAIVDADDGRAHHTLREGGSPCL